MAGRKTESFSRKDMTEILTQTGLSRTESKRFIDSFFLLIQEKVKNGDVVYLKGFGKLFLQRKKPRLFYVPRRKEVVSLKAKKVLRFLPSKVFFEQVKSRFKK